jgi:uncharacterized membrane protein SirB2
MSLKVLHIVFVLLTFLSFSLRGVWMLMESPLLKRKIVRIFPHIIDTCLLASGLTMALTYYEAFYTHSWLLAKLTALILYIATGSIALKYGKTKKIRVCSLIVSWLIFVYIVVVARTQSPIPLFYVG